LHAIQDAFEQTRQIGERHQLFARRKQSGQCDPVAQPRDFGAELVPRHRVLEHPRRVGVVGRVHFVLNRAESHQIADADRRRPMWDVVDKDAISATEVVDPQPTVGGSRQPRM
jgi:hypothetical protein